MFLREAWLQAQMAKTNRLLSLSAGALAFLLTLVSVVGFSTVQLPFYFLAALAFSAVLGCQLYILHKNPQQIEAVLAGKRERNKWMDRAEMTSLLAFGIGFLLVLFLGISYVTHPTPEAEQMMGSDKSDKSKQSRPNRESSDSKGRKNLSNIGNVGSSGSSDGASQQSGGSSQQSGGSSADPAPDSGSPSSGGNDSND